MKKIFTLLLIALLPIIVSAQATVIQGGTGLTSVASSSFLVGSISPLRLQAVSTTTVASLLNGFATGTNYWLPTGSDIHNLTGSKVGIGTSTPSVPLEVYGTNNPVVVQTAATTSGILQQWKDGAGNIAAEMKMVPGENGSQLSFYRRNGNFEFGSIGFTDGFSGLTIKGSNLTIQSDILINSILRIGNYQPLILSGELQTYAGQNLVIRPDTGKNTNFASGNVGIGTSTPTSLFHVVGSNPALTVTANDNYSTILKRLDTGGVTTRTNDVLLAGTASAISTDGTDYGSFGSNAALQNLNATGYTVAFWVKLNSGNTVPNMILSRWASDSNRTFEFYADPGGGFRYFINATQITPTSTSMYNNQWHRVVTTYNGATAKIYIDGALDTSAPVTETLSSTVMSTYIGSRTGAFPGVQLMQDLRIRKDVWSLAQVVADYNSGAGTYGTADANLIAGYHMDEGTGTSFADYSASGLTGTLSTTGMWTTGKIVTPSTSARVTPTVWRSEDGTLPNEYGIQTFGDASGTTALNGRNLVFKIKGVEKFRVNEQGYTGFGTANPSAPLEVSGSGSNAALLVSQGSTPKIIFKADGTVANAPGQTITFSNSSNIPLMSWAGGGITFSGAYLNLAGGGAQLPDSGADGSSYTQGFFTGGFSQYIGFNGGVGVFGPKSAAGVNLRLIGAASKTGNFLQLDDSTLANVFKVTAVGGGYFAGNLGIATDTPVASLAVTGTSTANPFLIASSSGSKMFEINKAGAALFANNAGTAGQILSSNGSTGAPTWTSTSSLISSFWNGSGTDTYNSNAGSVLVGTTTNTNSFYKLQTTNLLVVGDTPNLYMRGNASGTADGVSFTLGNTQHATGSGVRIQFNTAADTASFYGTSIETITEKNTNGLLSSPQNALLFRNSSGTTGSPTERMRITSAGLVGIGTTTPASQLSVVGRVDISNVLRVGGGSGGSGTNGDIVARRSANTGSYYFGDSTNNYLYFDGTNYQFGQAGLYANTNGSVGIGTDAPVTKLNVSNSAIGNTANPTPLLQFSTGSIFPQFPTTLTTISTDTTAPSNGVVGLNLENRNTNTGAYAPLITFSRYSTSGSYNASYAYIGAVNTGDGPDTNWASGDLTFATANSSFFGPREKMRLTSAGNLGIGSTSPGTLLSVAGTATVQNINTSSSVSTSTYIGGLDLKSANVVQHTFSSFSFSSTTVIIGTTTLPIGPASVNETWNNVKCFTDTGTVQVTFTDGTNKMNAASVTSSVTTTTFSSNNTFVPSEKRYLEIGTPASSPTAVSCTVDKTVNL